MGRALSTLLSLTLSGSVLIVVLLAIRPLLRRNLRHSGRYYLWLVPLARLLLPVFPAIRLPEGVSQALPEAISDGTLWLRAPDMALAGPDRQAAGLDLLSLLPGLLVILWGTVATALALRAVWRYVRCLHALERESCPAGERAQLVYEDACRMLDVTRPPRLLVCPGLRSPMQAGLLRPMVLLPDENSGEEVLRAALLHELTHYRRLDLCYKWLAEAAVCVHWFNPLVYVLRRELSRECELSCDEGVLGRLDESGRRVYGASLLALARPVSGTTKNNMTLAMSRDGEQLKERLYAIMKFESKGKLTGAVAVGVAAALCLCGVLAGAYAADLTGQAEESKQPDLLVISEPLATGEQAEIAAEELTSPLDGDTLTVTMSFGNRVHPITGETTSHDGLDIQAESGAAVYAPRSGQVLEAAFNQEYGNYVVIGWDGGEVLFAHLSACAVAEGDQVTQGQNVGYVGQTGMATGPHLHVEIRLDGELADPETCFTGVTFVH
ncbi:MAG: M23/M56 family metallopeptidase [Pseudoflavonifractor capillosus]|uniref:M23/M56 family metallopeptidase n=1 Tax=Pseudoflavonifractor capillosus TaxID=106588 RepID=UPI0023F84D40|nr:M23/M56 family metallopeptidase [Pseudoflavonifractor capillosus]MCI5928633.1 M23/M56 family metallopeptidase [Pseudoflavonifractor capillosus]MDY4659901.1 M23/M56 family metallopeptidase [Pseudoflavonifractor capillosus]